MESQAKELSEQEQYRRFYERFSVVSLKTLSRKRSASELTGEVTRAIKNFGLVRIGGEPTVEEIASLLQVSESSTLWRALWEADYRWSLQFRVDDEGAEKVLTDMLEWLWGFPSPWQFTDEDRRRGGPDPRLVAAQDLRKQFLRRTVGEEHTSTKFLRLLLSDFLARNLDSDLAWRLWNGSAQESFMFYQEATNMLLDGVREVTKDRPRTETRLDALAKTLKAPGSASKADGVDESL